MPKPFLSAWMCKPNERKKNFCELSGFEELRSVSTQLGSQMDLVPHTGFATYSGVTCACHPVNRATLPSQKGRRVSLFPRTAVVPDVTLVPATVWLLSLPPSTFLP